MQNYKDLKVWEKAHHFTIRLYDATKAFPKEEIYGLTSQISRSAVSIPANIAEGCGKKTQQEFAHFLNIFLGSANETEYYLILSKDLKYLHEEIYQDLFDSINEIKAMLITLIVKVRSN